MGLMFAEDLDAWRRWQRSRNRLRAVRSALSGSAPTPLTLYTRGEDALALFAVDAATPSAIAAVVAPLRHVGAIPLAVLAAADVSRHLPGRWHARPLESILDVPPELRGVRVVVAAGDYLPAGAAAYAWARRLGAPFTVVQHGLLTPFAPPLPRDGELLAFTDRDASFWTAGRPDVGAAVIGSQLLWEASRTPPAAVDEAERPTFLGQLHGAELSRRVSAATAFGFCRATGAVYRPHPAEVDRLSRWQHAAWRRRGIDVVVDRPLTGAGPVVSIFSTGVLEAAAAGAAAWVVCDDPPSWLREFWERYELAPWGAAATPAPAVPPVEPAAAVAERVASVVAGGS